MPATWIDSKPAKFLGQLTKALMRYLGKIACSAFSLNDLSSDPIVFGRLIERLNASMSLQ